MEIKFAPVTIPTLCRFDHFKKCLDSLEACVGSAQTDVFIALDYPAKENHWDGYNKINMYLKEKEANNHFKSLRVTRRAHNFGVGKNTLITTIFQEFDRVIISEDDNVFSPNFLLYINKGLSLCENDDKLIYVCGYTYPFAYKFDGNYSFHNSHFCAWGCAILRDRYRSITKELNSGFFKRTFSIKNYLAIRKGGFSLLFTYMNALFHDLVNDYSYRKTVRVVCVYLILKGYYVIMPSVSKVRNEGWDITGYSFQNGKQSGLLKQLQERHMRQEIDESLDFDFQGNPLTFFDYNNMITASSDEWPMSYGQYLINIFKMVMNGLLKKTVAKL